MTMETELYDNICNANIQKSIYVSTQILLHNQNNCFNILQNVFISICSYIGSFISIYEIQLWLDVVESVLIFIEEDKVDIKNIYILVTKMSIICDIYLKNPVTKTGSLSIKMVREKMIDMFTIDDFTLSESGIANFQGVFPPIDSPSYNLAIQIVTGYAYTLKKLDSLSLQTDENLIFNMANKIRHSIDYIIRKKYTFQTKFYESDNDSVWFLWGVISLLFNDKEMNTIYKLFNHEYKKSYKSKRIGLLWGAAVTMIYLKKKDIARTWNSSELGVLAKIKEISMTLYKDIKKQLKTEQDVTKDIDNFQHQSGIEYIRQYRPVEKTQNTFTEMHNNTNDNVSTTKMIRYKQRYY